jgi:hypothetical protein
VTTVVVVSSGDGAGISFVRSLRQAGGYRVIGVDTNLEDHLTSEADVRALIAPPLAGGFAQRVNEIAVAHSADLVYAADTGPELDAIFHGREHIGAATFLPDPAAADCEDKWATYEKLNAAGVQVPETILATDRETVRQFIGSGRDVWIRRRTGSGGAGSIGTADADFATAWIEMKTGWGDYTVAERLGTYNVTWTALWYDGSLQISQLRHRVKWKYGHLAPSGVTGITGIQRSVWDPNVHDLALRSVEAVVARPHGIVSVDFTSDLAGQPCPTEIQTSRFFTSIDFLAAVGLNFPDEYCRLALGAAPRSTPLVNPVRDEYYWIRAVDRLPALMSASDYHRAAG